MTTKLTIAIPTYNRPEALRKTLCAILPQLTRDCRVQIYDNHSQHSVFASISDLATDSNQIEYHQNRANIGANANILRCIEGAISDWVWVLGDDDQVLPNAIGQILTDIELHSDVFFISYTCALARSEKKIVTGVLPFLRAIDYFGYVNFISANVFNVSKTLKQLSVGYQFSYSLLPHSAMILRALSQGESVVVSNDRICLRPEESAKSQTWSYTDFAIQCPSLLELPGLTDTSRQLLSQKLREMAPSQFGTPLKLLQEATQPDSRRSALLLYKIFTARTFFLSRKTAIPFYLFRIFFIAPNLFLSILSRLLILAGKGIELENLLNRKGSSISLRNDA